LINACRHAPAMPLSRAPEGTRVKIESLPEHPGLRERLLALGIRPGVHVDVLRRGRPGGLLHLAHGLFEFMLRHEHAEQIAVGPPDGPTSASATSARYPGSGSGLLPGEPSASEGSVTEARVTEGSGTEGSGTQAGVDRGPGRD
jgi:ferrous iron transport protein A